MTPSVFVAIPAFGYQVNSYTAMSIYRMAQDLTKKGVTSGIAMLTSPDIVETRNTFLSLWYYKYPQYSHLLFIDADMEFSPDLVSDMLVLNKPLTGVMYRKKRDDPVEWVGSRLDGPVNVENGFMPVDNIGMGVAMISRSCVDTLIEKYPELVFEIPEQDRPEPFTDLRLSRVARLFDKIPEGYAHRSEDFSFCHRFREAGGEIYASVGHQVGHIGMKNYSGRLWDVLSNE